jgi:hypothetical protein
MAPIPGLPRHSAESAGGASDAWKIAPPRVTLNPGLATKCRRRDVERENCMASFDHDPQ